MVQIDIKKMLQTVLQTIEDEADSGTHLLDLWLEQRRASCITPFNTVQSDKEEFKVF